MTSNPLASLQSTLSKFHKDGGHSGKEIAAKIGISEGHFSRLLSGQTKPSIDVLGDWLSAYGLAVEITQATYQEPVNPELQELISAVPREEDPWLNKPWGPSFAMLREELDALRREVGGLHGRLAEAELALAEQG